MKISKILNRKMFIGKQYVLWFLAIFDTGREDLIYAYSLPIE